VKSAEEVKEFARPISHIRFECRDFFGIFILFMLEEEMENKLKRPTPRSLILLLTMPLFVFKSTQAQESPDDANKLRLAQSFERSGEYQRAAGLYEELYRRSPLNFVLFDGLHRMYMQLKKYDDAIALVQTRLERQPTDLVLLSTLGEDYLRAGKETEAHEAWERALASDKKNPNVYRYISNVLLQNRLFSQAADVLLRGRRTIGKESLFATELGYVYTILGKYSEATKEYVHALKESPTNLSFVETRIASYTAKPDGLGLAIAAVRGEIQNDKENVTLYRLLAWLYLEGKQFEQAFSVYQMIDQLSSSAGQELLAFASQTFKESAYEVSAKAYKEFIERYPKTQITPKAKFGYARAIEELSAKNDSLAAMVIKEKSRSEGQLPASETLPTFGGAIAYYDGIVHDYPGSEFALQSLYRIGLIKFDRFFDIDGALQTLDQIDRQFPNNPLAPEVSLKTAEILVAKGELTKAEERLSKVRGGAVTSQGEKDSATFALAEIDYFQGSFDSALVKLNKLATNLSADIANDALLLQGFIKEHQTKNELVLKEYARAEFLERQRKLSEAAAILEKLISTETSSPIVDDALLKLGELQRKMGDPMHALSAYQRLITEHPESILRDEAQFGIGEIYQLELKDKQRAIAAYEELLEKYPTSLYLDEVRKRIRQLRGDAL
jgi:tetratricopeptide (TPR) repeat protein